MRKQIQMMIVTLVSCLILTGCGITQQTSNNEIDEILRVEFEAIHGENIFDVGKKLEKLYTAVPEKEYCFTESYTNLASIPDASDRNNIQNAERIVFNIKYVPNQKELTVHYEHRGLNKETIEQKELKYLGKGHYVTMDNQRYADFDGLVLYIENQSLSWEAFKNKEYYSQKAIGDEGVSGNMDNVESLFDSIIRINKFKYTLYPDNPMSKGGFSQSVSVKRNALRTVSGARSDKRKISGGVQIEEHSNIVSGHCS